MLDWLKRLVRGPSTMEASLSPDPVTVDRERLNNGLCPECGGQLLEGPRGGMSVNAACDSCHREFNIGDMPGGGRFIIDRLGKLTAGRARLYGIKPEELKDA